MMLLFYTSGSATDQANFDIRVILMSCHILLTVISWFTWDFLIKIHIHLKEPSCSYTKLSTQNRTMGFKKHATFRFVESGNVEWESNCILRTRITDLLLTEYALRELIQHEERLQRKVIALRKATDTEADRVELQRAKGQLEKCQAQHPAKARALYEAESMLRPVFKELYDDMRRDPKWFMREEMVHDCADQGGCCSRECGCCAKRHLSGRKKGTGHCTTECECCIAFRGFELSEEEKKKISKNYKSRLNEPKSAYFVKMAHWFLLPYKLSTSVTSKLRGRRFW